MVTFEGDYHGDTSSNPDETVYILHTLGKGVNSIILSQGMSKLLARLGFLTLVSLPV